MTPEVLRTLLKTSQSIVEMFHEGRLAPVPAHGCPIHSERIVGMPSSRQTMTSGRTCHRASRVGNASFRYVETCLVSKRHRPILIVHSRVNAMESHLRARLQCTESRLQCEWLWISQSLSCAMGFLANVVGHLVERAMRGMRRFFLSSILRFYFSTIEPLHTWSPSSLSHGRSPQGEVRERGAVFEARIGESPACSGRSPHAISERALHFIFNFHGVVV